MLGFVLDFLEDDRAPRGFCDHCSVELRADHALNKCCETGCKLFACRPCTWKSSAHILNRAAYGSFCVHHCKTAMESEIQRLKKLKIATSEVLCRATILCCHARTCVRACLRCVRACVCVRLRSRAYVRACVRACVRVCVRVCVLLHVSVCECVSVRARCCTG